MADFTTPKTWSAGDVATAADLNTYVRDNVAFIATDAPKVRVFRSTDQTITTATATVVDFTSESFKTVAGLHSNSTNPSRIVIPSAFVDGLFLLTANIGWAANNTGYRLVEMLKNGSDVIAASKIAAVGSTQTTIQTVSTIAQLAENDYVQVRVTQNSGGSLAVSAATDYSPVFAAVWLMN